MSVTKKLSLQAGRPSSSKRATTLAELADAKGPQVRINFDVDREDHVWLKVHAAQNGTTIADLLREKIKELRQRADT